MNNKGFSCVFILEIFGGRKNVPYICIKRVKRILLFINFIKRTKRYGF